MDTQFKQRLTGAVILVLLAVLLVPELLTGPKATPPGPTSLALPPAQTDGAPLRSYDIDLTESRDSPAPAAPAEAPAAGPAVTAPMVPATPAAAAAARQPAPAPQPPPVEEQDAPAVERRGYAVQVGSFASRASADRLAADLRRRRFETFVAPVRASGRQMFRVRVGPVADRAAAQALAGQLKSVGQDGSIVSLP